MRLFTAFHGNLDFSALPDQDRPIVIERCYWPLLDLPEAFGIPIGFEMSARTLRALETEDPEWVKRFRGLVERDLVEPIASGWAQIVAPLVPAEVNRANLRIGSDVYRDILGFVPETYFVNEQTFSAGLVPLFVEAGARQIVMEWNNPAASRPELRSLRCQPARLHDVDSPGLRLLWNDSIVFQKVQRYAQGATPIDELMRLIDRLAESVSAEALCVYGGDVEIFDYRPSRAISSGPGKQGAESEISRLIGLFRRLAGDPRFEFSLPRNVVEEPDLLPEVQLGSARDPIPCKKQPRYNPTRWGVSGRDGFGMNTRCHEVFELEQAVHQLAGNTDDRVLTPEGVDLWRSDFRTRATEEKIVEFDTGVGLARTRAIEVLRESAPLLRDGEDVLIVNSGNRAWERTPVEIPLRLAAGTFFDIDIRSRRGPKLEAGRHQIEVSGRNRDGSIREATLVIEPSLAGHEQAAFSVIPRTLSGPATDVLESSESISVCRTENVEAGFLSHRGGALARLAFPGILDRPVVGTIAHGTFDDIAFTPDFYSGHVVAVTETGDKQTDLKHCDLISSPDLCGPVRVAVETQIETIFGPWRKTYHLYRNQPRIDLSMELGFYEARLASLRLGTMTLLPGGLDRETLRYGTVNGGRAEEWYSLADEVEVAQSRAVSSSVSATSCLGATDGWVALEDASTGLLIQENRSQAAAVPMLDFSRLDESYFCRLQYSAAETDETRATFLRGKKSFSFSVSAYHPGDSSSLARVRRPSHGLVYRTEKSVGIASSL